MMWRVMIRHRDAPSAARRFDVRARAHRRSHPADNPRQPGPTDEAHNRDDQEKPLGRADAGRNHRREREQEIKRRQRHLNLRPAHDQIVGEAADVSGQRAHRYPQREADQHADQPHEHAHARAINDAREQVAAQAVAAHHVIGLILGIGGEQMAAGKKMNVDPARGVGRVIAFLGVDHAHRMRPEKSPRPFRGGAQMRPHRRTVGHPAILINRIVGREKWRDGREQIEDQQAGRGKAYGARRQPPLAGQPTANTGGSRGLLQLHQCGGRRAHCVATDEKSTRGSTATSAMSASRLPTSSRTVPISTDPITR